MLIFPMVRIAQHIHCTLPADLLNSEYYFLSEPEIFPNHIG